MATMSVLVPTYHRPRLLKRALDSVIAQDYPDLVVHVSDNGADAETLELGKSYSKRFPFIRYERNHTDIGGPANFKKLLGLVDTPYYLIISDDDFLLPGFLATAMGEAIKPEHADLGFICAPSFTVNAIAGTIFRRNQDWTPGRYQPSVNSVKRMYRSHFTSTGVIFTRQVIERLGGFSDLGDDTLFLTMLSGIYSFLVLERPGAAFIVHESSLTTLGGIALGNSLTALRASMYQELKRCELLVPPDCQDLLQAIVVQKHVAFMRSHILHLRLNPTRDRVADPTLETIVDHIAFDSNTLALVRLVPRRLLLLLKCIKRLLVRNPRLVRLAADSDIAHASYGHCLRILRGADDHIQ